MTSGKWAGVVLAAGGSSRMGRPKQLLPVSGRPLLERVVAAVCGSRLDHVVAPDVERAVLTGGSGSLTGS